MNLFIMIQEKGFNDINLARRPHVLNLWEVLGIGKTCKYSSNQRYDNRHILKHWVIRLFETFVKKIPLLDSLKCNRKYHELSFHYRKVNLTTILFILQRFLSEQELQAFLVGRVQCVGAHCRTSNSKLL